MNAAAAQRNPMSSEARPNEPSMEEILASIRRIIADDQAVPRQPRSIAAEPLEAHRPLPAAVKLAHSAPSEPELDHYESSEPDLPERSDHLSEPPIEEAAETATEALISPQASASVSSAFESLATSMLMQNTDMLEQVARELLRPMLKNWLDDNLPTIVERLVRTEIERVARGRRG
jgi:cell pole-organizing protein PopZ